MSGCHVLERFLMWNGFQQAFLWLLVQPRAALCHEQLHASCTFVSWTTDHALDSFRFHFDNFLLTKVELPWLWALLYSFYKYVGDVWFSIIIFVGTSFNSSHLPYNMPSWSSITISIWKTLQRWFIFEHIALGASFENQHLRYWECAERCTQRVLIRAHLLSFREGHRSHASGFLFVYRRVFSFWALQEYEIHSSAHWGQWDSFNSGSRRKGGGWCGRKRD